MSTIVSNKIAKRQREAIVEKNCVACGCCVTECKLGAIEVYKGIIAKVNDKCVGCGKCEKVCPCCAITVIEKEV